MSYMTSTRKKRTCSRSSATVSLPRELSAVCQLAVSSVRTCSIIARRSAGVIDASSRLMSSRATRCCCRSNVRRVDSVGCAVNTGSILSVPSSSATSSIDMPLARNRRKHSSRPPGCGVLLSFRYWRRRRTRCTFSAMFTIWNQVENARISSAACPGSRPAVRSTRRLAAAASPLRRSMAAWRSPSTSSKKASPPWSRSISPTKLPSVWTSSRSAASLSGNVMSLRAMTA